MALQRTEPVIDLYPWPNGLGFQNGSRWWDYVHSQGESQKLDLLLAAALLSEEVARLLLDHDERLHRAFRLSEPTITLLNGITAATLIGFTAALVAEIAQAG